MQLLAKFRVLPYSKAKTLRKWVVPTAFLFAALITPSLDGMLTFLVALPMLILYELGLIAGWLSTSDEGNYFADLPMVQKIYGLILGIKAKLLGLVRKIRNSVVKLGSWIKQKLPRI
jgi:hypothetical protein